MFKNKLVQLVVIILIALALIALVVVILFNTILKSETDPTDPNAIAEQSVEDIKAAQLSADEMLEQTVHMNDITANLASKDLIQASFSFELESVKAKEEFEKLDFVTKDIVLRLLANKNPEQLQGSKGMDELSAELMEELNSKLTEDGKVTRIYITKLLMP